MEDGHFAPNNHDISVKGDTMLCSRCQANVDNNAQFCPFCGNRLPNPNERSPFITIGRNPDNDIVLSDSSVSRQHARVRSEQGCLTIEDMGSANGTYVNGYRIQLQRLSASDSIQIGSSTQLSYRDIEAASSRKFGYNHYSGGQTYVNPSAGSPQVNPPGHPYSKHPQQPAHNSISNSEPVQSMNNAFQVIVQQPAANSVYQGGPIESHLVKAIVSFFFFWPLGIAAIIYAIRTNSLVASRDFNQAMIDSQKAKKYADWAFIVGPILTIFLLLTECG